jgi:hypothetical protein
MDSRARAVRPQESCFDLNADVLSPLAAAGGLSAFVAEYEFLDMGHREVFLFGSGPALEGKLGIIPVEPPTSYGIFVDPSQRIALTAVLAGPIEVTTPDGLIMNIQPPPVAGTVTMSRPQTATSPSTGSRRGSMSCPVRSCRQRTIPLPRRVWCSRVRRMKKLRDCACRPSPG